MGTITASFQVIGSNLEGDITNVYGPQYQQEKDKLMQRLELIRTLVSTRNWILGGDFNMILTLEEKSGGLKRLDQDSTKFIHLIYRLNLINIETINGSFKWTKKREGVQHIANILDCFLISENIMLEGPLIEAKIFPRTSSDH